MTVWIAAVICSNSTWDWLVAADASSMSWFRSAPILTTPSVSAWTCPMSSEICAAACWESSASLRTSSATTANPRPCSPARAASMAAFSASRFVWAAMPEIVSTIWPICSERSASPWMRLPVSAAVSCTRSNASALARMAAMPLAASSAISSADARVCSAAERASPLMVACCSAPEATSLTACAISETARPVSCDVAAISCDEAESSVAELAICSTRRAVFARMVVKLSIPPRTRASMRLNVAPSSPSSSRERWITGSVALAAAQVRSPAATASSPAASWARSSSSRLRRRPASSATDRIR